MRLTFEKSKKFAVRIINLYKHLSTQKNEFVMSKQLLRSGTSIGANLAEAEHAQSNDDFIHKYNIALKEASESKYWLDLLFETDYISEKEYNSLIQDCKEINRLLASSIITLKNNKR